MAINYPGPFEVRIFYTTAEPAGVNEHVLRLSCQMSISADPGDPFSDWIPIDKGGSAVTALNAKVDALMAVIQPLMPVTTDFSLAELWEYAPGTFDAVYRSSYDLNLLGTNATAVVPFSQTIWSFRSQLGGVMKVDLRGTPYAAGPRLSFPTPTNVVNTFANFMLADASIWWARDNSYPVAAIRWLPGSNEHAFKQINR